MFPLNSENCEFTFGEIWAEARVHAEALAGSIRAWYRDEASHTNSTDCLIVHTEPTSLFCGFTEVSVEGTGLGEYLEVLTSVNS